LAQVSGGSVGTLWGEVMVVGKSRILVAGELARLIVPMLNISRHLQIAVVPILSQNTLKVLMNMMMGIIEVIGANAIENIGASKRVKRDLNPRPTA
jgi:hypothetical protein